MKKRERILMGVWLFWSAFLLWILLSSPDLSFYPLLILFLLFLLPLKRTLGKAGLFHWRRLDAPAHLYFLARLLVMNACMSVCLMAMMLVKETPGYQVTGLVSTLCLLIAFYHLLWAWD